MMNNQINLRTKNALEFDQKDSLKETCDVIYERYRRNKLEKNYLKLIRFLISLVLSIGTIVLISLVNYDVVNAVKNNQTKYLDSVQETCNKITYGVIDLITTPVSIALTVFYVIIYKRRIFLVNNFKYKNIGLPMITTIWNKSFRFNSAMVYGLMAQTVVEIVASDGSNKADNDIRNVNDPTGIVKLLFQIAQVILVGISMCQFYNCFFIQKLFEHNDLEILAK
jgi:hypothetical protein